MQNFSEPAHLIAPSSGDLDRRKKCKEMRRDFAQHRAYLRRHTTSLLPRLDDLLDDVAQSEDSVFVHDG